MSFTENKNLMIFDNFVKEKENKVEENYQIIISDESLYLIKSSVNYGEYIKSIFSGAGDIIGLFGNTVGVLGGLASELTGHKFSQMLKEYSDKSSKKNTNKVIENLDTISSKKKGITKIDFSSLIEISIKKGFVINGQSAIEFHQNDRILKLHCKQRSILSELISEIKNRNEEVLIKAKYF